ncbi:MAG: tetratricopeptide repeat protein [Mobilitalea sp.]
MICPNCGSNMSDKRKRCERCGSDMTIYKKIYGSSNLYYNNGLAKARVRDLTGATIALRSSLELNKMNTNARNLLGLIYYEMGDTVAALSEWVVSKHFQPTDNDADEYINKVQSNPTRLDALNQAIKRYNTALNFAKQGNDDLSIIQLKKVINLNPHFLRAYHLLAILLMKAGENDKAKKYLFKAGKIDVSNTTTLRYMQELETPASLSKDLEGNPEAEQGVMSTIIPLSSYREDKPNIMAFVNLVIGVLIGIAVTAFLILPTIQKNQTSDKNSDYVDYGTGLSLQQEKDNTISSLEQDKEELTQELEQLRTEIDAIVIPENNSLIYDPLLEATELYMLEQDKAESEQDFAAIADILASIDAAKYESESSVKILNRIREATYPSVAKLHYDSGHALYSDAKYDEALVELTKAMTFDPTDVDAIYFTARTYHRLDDKEKAAKYYKIVVTDYPDSSRVADASVFLEQVQE